MTTAPLLEVRGVTKYFGAVQALSEVNLKIQAGEIVALLGDNGAGKSTLVKTLAGVYQPDAGQIYSKMERIQILNPQESRALGIATIYQDLALCENLDVVANLFLGRAIRKFTLQEEEMERDAWKLLRRLSAKLPSLRIPVANLSGGQRQTVAIARSLVGDPIVMLLDEPTAALGLAQTFEVLRLIENLRDQGIGILLITHNLADVRAVADRAVVLRLGRNNGEFKISDTSQEELVSAITGALITQ